MKTQITKEQFYSLHKEEILSTLPEDFIKFMKQKGAWESYVKNCDIEFEKFNLMISNNDLLLDGAFYWPNSKEGDDYWIDISIEWDSIKNKG